MATAVQETDREVRARDSAAAPRSPRMSRASQRNGEARLASRSLSRSDLAVAAALAVTCAIVALLRSFVTDLQGDELWTRLMVRLPVNESWPFVVRDGKHPPFYLLLQWLLGHVVPDTPTALRAVSILSAAVAPGALFLFARRFNVSAVLALAVAVWVGLHPLLLTYAVYARSYALLAALVLVHGLLLFDSLVRPQQSRWWLVAATSAVTVVTHAFGAMYVGVALVAALTWVMLQRPESRVQTVRHLVLAHVPAYVVGGAWFGFVWWSLRGTSGIVEGLQWVEFPSLQERIYTLGLLLGNPGIPRGTTLTLTLWTAMLLPAAWHWSKPQKPRLAPALVVAVIMTPFLVQNLVTGLVLDLPLWGDRHVLPVTLFTGAGLLLLAASSLLPLWGQRSSALLLVALTAVSLTTVPQWPRTFMTDMVAWYRSLPEGSALRATYLYGDLNVANYYLDRRCVDAFQLRVQFPDVGGVADSRTRSDLCVAKPPAVAGEPGQLTLLVFRPFVEQERAVRDSMVAAGWNVVLERAARPPEKGAAVLLSRER